MNIGLDTAENEPSELAKNRTLLNGSARGHLRHLRTFEEASAAAAAFEVLCNPGQHGRALPR